MPRLEQELEELGYVYNAYNKEYTKVYKDFWEFNIRIGETNIEGYICSSTETDIYIAGQEDVDYFQQLFDMLKNDLKILKAIDKPTPKNDIGNELWEKDVKHMQELGEWERKQ